MPRLHLTRSSYDVSVCDFPYDFRHRRWSWATTYVLTIKRYFTLAFVDVFSQNRMEIVGYPHSFIGNRTEPVRCPRGVPMISDWALAVSLRSPYDVLSTNYHSKPFGDRRVSVRRAHDVSTGYGFAIFKKLSKCRVFQHRRIILRTPDENAKIGICDHRKLIVGQT